jgi:hypothetical protein
LLAPRGGVKRSKKAGGANKAARKAAKKVAVIIAETLQRTGQMDKPAPDGARASASSHRLTVHQPGGTLEVVQSHAARLGTLAGKTIGELSNGVWEDQRTFEAIRAALQKRLPDTTFVPFTKFAIGSEQIDSETAIDRLIDKGCDAVITGNAA